MRQYQSNAAPATRKESKPHLAASYLYPETAADDAEWNSGE